MDQNQSFKPEGAPACAQNADAGAPSGLKLWLWSIDLTSGCGDLYRSRLSHRTVPHPRRTCNVVVPVFWKPCLRPAGTTTD